MIAARTVADTAPAPTGFLIADERSRAVFNPDTRDWEPFTGPLQAADWARLVVGPQTARKFASLTTWPVKGLLLLWADLGDDLPGDLIVAIPFGYDPQGNPYPAAYGALGMDLTASDAMKELGGKVGPAPGVTKPPNPPTPVGTPPSVPQPAAPMPAAPPTPPAPTNPTPDPNPTAPSPGRLVTADISAPPPPKPPTGPAPRPVPTPGPYPTA